MTDLTDLFKIIETPWDELTSEEASIKLEIGLQIGRIFKEELPPETYKEITAGYQQAGCTCEPDVTLYTEPKRGERIGHLVIAHDDECPLG